MQKQPVSAGIIDNEQHAREIIALLLANYFPEIQVTLQAAGVEEAVQSFASHLPDLVFLDVEMDDGSGFDVLDRLEKRPERVLFVTAYDHYAIQAIRAAAFDYILKPVNQTEFVAAVNRALRTLPGTPPERPSPERPLPGRVAIPHLTGLRLVETENILCCEADGNYSIVHFADGCKETVSRSLGQLESELQGERFFRVHHKHLINLQHLVGYERDKGGGHVLLNGGKRVQASTRKKAELLGLFHP